MQGAHLARTISILDALVAPATLDGYVNRMWTSARFLHRVEMGRLARTLMGPTIASAQEDMRGRIALSTLMTVIHVSNVILWVIYIEDKSH